MDIGTAKSSLLTAWWWFVVAFLAFGYAYAVPDGLSVLAILARIIAAGLAVMGLVAAITHFVSRPDARRGGRPLSDER